MSLLSARHKLLQFLANLPFALFLLFLLIGASITGSILEQGQPLSYYQENYPLTKPIYGFISWPLIMTLGADHLFQTAWFFFLLLLLAFSLSSCTLLRQFPLFLNSKQAFFKKQKQHFWSLPFFAQNQNLFYLQELFTIRMQLCHFYVYQKKNLSYSYKGLVGRISPLLVHFSMLSILFGACVGAFKSYKAQEALPKGELFHVQNTGNLSSYSFLGRDTLRVNDFWGEHEKNQVRQFYANCSLLNDWGEEKTSFSISVNNPFKYKQIDFYQGDWNFIGLRAYTTSAAVNKKSFNEILETFNGKEKGKEFGWEAEADGFEKANIMDETCELPLFSLRKDSKAWVTAFPLLQPQPQEDKDFLLLGDPLNERTPKKSENKKKKSILVFDKLQSNFLIFNHEGKFLSESSNSDSFGNSKLFLEPLSSTGLFIKADPSIPIIYFGFALMMGTTCLSYLPYTQLWVFDQSKRVWIGGLTNRGKIQLETQLESLIRGAESFYKQP